MRVVATGAGHLTFAVRHVRRALKLRLPHLVARETQLGLRLFGAVNICQRSVVPCIGREFADRLRLMPDVTVDARDLARVMRAALPEQSISSFVTREACAV